jgi:hypothetical protein
MSQLISALKGLSPEEIQQFRVDLQTLDIHITMQPRAIGAPPSPTVRYTRSQVLLKPDGTELAMLAEETRTVINPSEDPEFATVYAVLKNRGDVLFADAMPTPPEEGEGEGD